LIPICVVALPPSQATAIDRSALLVRLTFETKKRRPDCSGRRARPDHSRGIVKATDYIAE
jgi:hypothetical protein